MKTPIEETALRIFESLDEYAREYDHYEYGLPTSEPQKSTLLQIITDGLDLSVEAALKKEWVPISEPPTESGEYLVFGGLFGYAPIRSVKVFDKSENRFISHYAVTHWMPLPKEPTV